MIIKYTLIEKGTVKKNIYIHIYTSPPFGMGSDRITVPPSPGGVGGRGVGEEVESEVYTRNKQWMNNIITWRQMSSNWVAYPCIWIYEYHIIYMFLKDTDG